MKNTSREDKQMDVIEMANQQAEGELEALQETSQIDASYLIQKIDQILADSSYVTTALQQLENLDEAGAMAAGNIVEYRERTNQRMIDFLEKLMGKLTL